MVALDAAILMHPRDWEASGHLAELHRPARRSAWASARSAGAPTTCEPGARDGELRCPECGGELGEAREFNLMFETFMGPVREDAARIFLRPETAQGIFVNFKNVLQFSRKKPPFGIAQIGKAFRNEITPGNFIFRTREFEQMEIEFFVPPAEAAEWHQHWMDDRMRWYTDLGIRPDHLQLRKHGDDELSHYSAGDHRRRVPVPDGLVGAGGNRQPHRLRPEPPRRVLGRGSAYFDPATERALRPVRDRALGRRRPRDARVHGRRLRRGGGRRPQAHACCACTRGSRP